MLAVSLVASVSVCFRTSAFLALFPTCIDLCSRTIVPIYQSEISPPNHVRRVSSLQSNCALTLFTARCIGMYGVHGQYLWLCLLRRTQHYSCICLANRQLTSRTVDRLLLLVYGLQPRLASTSLHPVCHWCHPRCRFASHAGEPSVSLYHHIHV